MLRGLLLVSVGSSVFSAADPESTLALSRFQELATKYSVDLSSFRERELEFFQKNFVRHAMEPNGVADFVYDDVSDNDDPLKQLFLDSAPVVTAKSFSELMKKSPSAWQAEANPSRFEGMSVRDAKKLMGTFLKGKYAAKLNVTKTDADYADVLFGEEGEEENFDGRLKWGTMCPSIGHVRDQVGVLWPHGHADEEIRIITA